MQRVTKRFAIVMVLILMAALAVGQSLQDFS